MPGAALLQVWGRHGVSCMEFTIWWEVSYPPVIRTSSGVTWVQEAVGPAAGLTWSGEKSKVCVSKCHITSLKDKSGWARQRGSRGEKVIGWGNTESNMLETIICNLRSSIAGEWDARVTVGTEETVGVDTGQMMKYNLSLESDFAFVLRPMITQ